MPEYNIDQDTREQIAEWLVRTGGEDFQELDPYMGELEEGIDRYYYGDPPDDSKPEPTPDDKTYITTLVALAKVTVHLPDDEAVAASMARRQWEATSWAPNVAPEDRPKRTGYVTRWSDEQIDTFARAWAELYGDSRAADWPNVQSSVWQNWAHWLDSEGLDMWSVMQIQSKLGYRDTGE